MVKSLRLLGKSLGCRLHNGSCIGGDGGGSSEGYEITYNATGGGEKMECVWCASEGVCVMVLLMAVLVVMVMMVVVVVVQTVMMQEGKKHLE